MVHRTHPHSTTGSLSEPHKTLENEKGDFIMEKKDIILGLDISTSVIGMCGINDKKELKFMSYVSLKKQKDLFEKVDAFKEELIKWEPRVVEVAIEEPLVMFKEGFSMAQIIAKLSRFNGMCSMLAYFIYKSTPVYYNVNTARSLAFPDMRFPRGSKRKEIVRERVAEFYPEVDWPLKRTGPFKDECFDMADAAIIALAHVEATKNG